MLGRCSVASFALLLAATTASCSPSHEPSFPSFVDQSRLPLARPQPPPASQQDVAPGSYLDRLIRYSWRDPAAAEEGVRQLRELEVDIWQTRRHSVQVRVANRAQSDAIADLWADADRSAPGWEVPAEEVLLPSVRQLLETSPSLSAPYNLAHSAAALANVSAAPSALRSVRSAAEDPIHSSYHSYDAIVSVLRLLAAEYPQYAEVVTFGTTSEGREIVGLKVHNKQAAVASEDEEIRTRRKKKKGRKSLGKLGFVVIGTQHAREWIAASTSLYLAHELLLSTATSTPSSLLDRVEFTILPVTNVDGYVYSWTTDRLWRKNRQPVGNGCFGVDLNRNWGYRWQPGTRPNPCSDAYPGSKAFVAPELQALEAYLSNTTHNIRAFLDLHSFGQMLMYPYSFSCDVSTRDEENHFEAVVGAAKSLKGVHGRAFETGSVCSVSLTSTGESLDWTYSVAKISWSFAAELRDLGVFGFLLPPSQIIPSGQEMYAALTSLANFVLNKEAGGR